ncbi:MAG: hypothetical protein VX877_03220, partial [Planctomycetota bacterium]|nr:hypothetical protein [Planctomycetota bacterium]
AVVGVDDCHFLGQFFAGTLLRHGINPSWIRCYEMSCDSRAPCKGPLPLCRLFGRSATQLSMRLTERGARLYPIGDAH